MIKKLLSYLLKGLLFTAPIAVTIYIIYQSFIVLDRILIIPHYPGIGILIILLGLIFLGWFGSSVIIEPIFNYFEKSISKTPLIKVIYTSIKDLLSAFVGEKKRFKHPVRVCINVESQVWKLGFITNNNLSEIGLDDKFIGVYCPHSYAFSGEFILVPANQVVLVEKKSTDIMKFIISGGVSNLNNGEK